MKRILNFAIVALMAVAAASSCKKNDPVYYSIATCTYKPVIGGPYFLKVDENTAFRVTNSDMSVYPFKDLKEKRALIWYQVDNNAKADPVPGFAATMAVNIARVDTIKTKAPVAYDPQKSRGNDYIGLYLSPRMFPYTMIEDGYLMVVMELPTMGGTTEHIINLVTGVNPSDPYEVLLCHDAQGNVGPYTFTAIMCFPLEDLPDTEGETKDLTLKWKSINTGNIECVTFNYKSRTDWH